MEGDCSVVRLMNRISSDIRRAHIANHVEMDGIPAEFKRLPHVCELCVGKSRGQRVITI